MESSPTVAIDRGFFHCFHFNFGGKNRIKIMFQEDYEFFMPDCCAKNHWIAKQKTQKKKETQTNNHESDTFLKTSRVLRRGHFPALCFFLFPESAVKNFRAAPKTEKEIKEGRDVLGMEFAKMYFFW